MEVNAGRVQRYTQRLGRRRAQVDYISRCTNEDCEKGDKKACCESGDPSEFRSCVNVEVAVWAPVPNKPTVSVDVKQHSTTTAGTQTRRVGTQTWRIGTQTGRVDRGWESRNPDRESRDPDSLSLMRPDGRTSPGLAVCVCVCVCV